MVKNALRFIGRKDYERRHYYRGRWPYVKRVIELASRLPGVERVLELGPGPLGRSIVDGADTMGLHDGPTILHDARIAPWPVADKAYDLFIAMQVFEHLDGQQRRAFAEARRIADCAILTLPYFCKSLNHRLGHKHYIRWFGLPTSIEIIDGMKCNKAVLYFDFTVKQGGDDAPR